MAQLLERSLHILLLLLSFVCIKNYAVSITKCMNWRKQGKHLKPFSNSGQLYFFNFNNHVTILLHPTCFFFLCDVRDFCACCPKEGGKRLSDTGIVKMCPKFLLQNILFIINNEIILFEIHETESL